jgi:hypothetical protein
MEIFGKLKHSSLLCRGINYTLEKFNDRRSWSQSYKENLEQIFSLSTAILIYIGRAFWLKMFVIACCNSAPHLPWTPWAKCCITQGGLGK